MFRFLKLSILGILLFSCKNAPEEKNEINLSNEFKEYWFSGEAEITSYALQQARYGEMREGEAVLIYVTEDFLPEAQVKASTGNEDNISVLKLNATKNFVTGIYPYSIMQSTFYPLNGEEHALKVSASIQEWCGQVYMQLNKRENLQIKIHSYFQGEADQDLELEKFPLENEVWNKLRTEHRKLPTGEFKMIPSFEYLRLMHKAVKAYVVTGEYYTNEEFHVYKLSYPQLKRELKIYYTKEFPHTIEKWEESYPSGAAENAKILTTKAVKKERLKTDYWNKNSNKNIPLRERLELN